MKKLIAALLITGTIIVGAGTVQACDCEIATIPVNGKDYAYTFFTVEGFKKDYITLKSTINGEVDDYYIGFVSYGTKFKVGEEAVVLYDTQKDLEITQIIGVDYN